MPEPLGLPPPEGDLMGQSRSYQLLHAHPPEPDQRSGQPPAPTVVSPPGLVPRLMKTHKSTQLH